MTHPNSKPNPLLTSPSSKNLTIRGLLCPHYFEVQNEWGRRVRTTGTEEDAISVCEIHPTWKYKIIFPKPPLTVDVESVRIKERELPQQKILPESQSIELNL